MLKEIFYVEVTTEYPLTSVPPMNHGRKYFETFPSVEKIEEAITELGGNCGKIDKKYLLSN